MTGKGMTLIGMAHPLAGKALTMAEMLNEAGEFLIEVVHMRFFLIL